jgi:hypothetical protein
LDGIDTEASPNARLDLLSTLAAHLENESHAGNNQALRLSLRLYLLQTAYA